MSEIAVPELGALTQKREGVLGARTSEPCSYAVSAILFGSVKILS
jgi:hypothetical protein